MEEIRTTLDCFSQLAHVKVSLPNGAGAAMILKELASISVSLDFVMMRQEHLMFTVASTAVNKVAAKLDKFGCTYHIEERCVVMSLNGHVSQLPDLTAAMSEELVSANIPLLQVLGSCTNVSVLIAESHSRLAEALLRARLPLLTVRME